MSSIYARKNYNYGIGFCFALFILTAYLQFFAGVLPCALCQLQRIALAIIFFLFLMGSIHNPARLGITRYGRAILFFSLIGAAVALRQIYLEHAPSAPSEACGMSMEYLLRVLPLDEAIKMIFRGTEDCTTVTWRFLELSLACWSFASFIVLGIIGYYPAYRLKKIK